MGMSRIDFFAAYENFFRVVFDYVVGVVGAIGNRHAAARMIGTICVRAVITAVVEEQYAAARHGDWHCAVIVVAVVKIISLFLWSARVEKWSGVTAGNDAHTAVFNG